MTSSRSRIVAPSLLRCLTVSVLLVLNGAVFSQPAPIQPVYFEEFLTRRFADGSGRTGWNIERLCPVSESIVARRVLANYGSMFSAHESVVLPSVCIQPGEAEVKKFQETLKIGAVDIDGIRIWLQTPAADKLRTSVSESYFRGLTISPLDGVIAGRRSYGDTLMLWNSRFFPAMEFWIKRGMLTEAHRDEITRLDLPKKIEKVLEWESQGIFFSTSRTRSILTSTAPPGASQHLSLIAFDVVEYWNAEVRGILNRNGWFQTIVDDPPHFTYLGFAESELPNRGLRTVYKGAHKYWVPNMSIAIGTR